MHSTGHLILRSGWSFVINNILQFEFILAETIAEITDTREINENGANTEHTGDERNITENIRGNSET